MKKYTVCYAVAEIYVDVEADSESEAEEKAEDQLAELDWSLCHQCSSAVSSCDPYHVSTTAYDDEYAEVPNAE